MIETTDNPTIKFPPRLSWQNPAANRIARSDRRDSLKCGCGRRMADGGRRTADGGRRTADGGRRTADGGRDKSKKNNKIIIK